MKPKGINIVEQHIEKAVLGVAGAALLGVAAMQFLGGNTVEVDGKKRLPREATDFIQDKAIEVSNRMNEAGRITAAELPKPPSRESLAIFTGTTGEAPKPTAQLVQRPKWSVFAGVSSEATPGVPETPTTEPMFAVAELPTPSVGAIAQYAATVDPSIPLLYPEAKSFLPPKQPMDEFWVTIEGAFPAKAYREALRNAGVGGEDTLSLPSSWLEGIELVRVELVRQTWNSSAQSWGADEVIGTLPGRTTAAEILDASEMLPAQLPDLRELERVNRTQIRRPSFYRTIAGPRWSPPSLLSVEIDEDVRMERDELLADIDRVERRIANFRQRLERLERTAEERTPTDGGDRRPGGRADAGWPTIPDTVLAQNPFGGDDRDRTPTDREDPTQAAMERIRADIEREQERLDDLLADLAALGFNSDGSPMGSGPSVDRIDRSLMDEEAESLPLWAHDATVEPGGKYRYAMRVEVINPFFGRLNSMPEAQRSLAESPTVGSALSDWSAPIVVDTPLRVFALGASEGVSGSGIGAATTAQLKAYSFFYGYWRSIEATVRPGDRLVGTAEMPQGLVTYAVSVNDGEVSVDSTEAIENSAMRIDPGVYLLDVDGAARAVGGEAVVMLRLSDGTVVPMTVNDEPADGELVESERLGRTASISEPDEESLELGDPEDPRNPGRDGGTPGDRDPRDPRNPRERDPGNRDPGGRSPTGTPTPGNAPRPF